MRPTSVHSLTLASALLLGACLEIAPPPGPFGCDSDDDCRDNRRCGLFDGALRACGGPDPQCPVAQCRIGVREAVLGCGLASGDEGGGCLVQGGCGAGVCVVGECANVEPVAAACDDGSPCTVDDFCVDGACVGTPKVCPDCRSCRQEDGLCVADPALDGVACAPGSACFADGSCSAGSCADGRPITWHTTFGVAAHALAFDFQGLGPRSLVLRSDRVDVVAQALFDDPTNNRWFQYLATYDMGGDLSLQVGELGPQARSLLHGATALEGGDLLVVGELEAGSGQAFVARMTPAGGAVWVRPSQNPNGSPFVARYQSACSHDTEVWIVGDVEAIDGQPLPWMWRIDPDTGDELEAVAWLGHVDAGRWNACRVGFKSVALVGFELGSGGRRHALMGQYLEDQPDAPYVGRADGFYESELTGMTQVATKLVARPVGSPPLFPWVGLGRAREQSWSDNGALLLEFTSKFAAPKPYLLGADSNSVGYAMLRAGDGWALWTTKDAATTAETRLRMVRLDAAYDIVEQDSVSYPYPVAPRFDGANVYAEAVDDGMIVAFPGPSATHVMKVTLEGGQLCGE